MATRRNTVQLEASKLPSHVKPHVSEGASLYSSPVFHGYSMWLLPSQGEDCDFLASVIKHTADELSTDAFLPHLSVLAGINDRDEEWLLKRMEMLEQRLKHNFDDIFVPEMRLHGLGARDLFFQCVYAHPVLTKSITGINKVACEVFERPGNGCGYDAAWMPHLSLVYGDLDLETKTSTMANLALDVIGKAFHFGTLQLWHTEGLHTDWRCVKSVDLPLPLDESSALAGSPTSKIGGMGTTDMYNWAAARKAMIRAHDFATKKSSSELFKGVDELGIGGEGEGEDEGEEEKEKEKEKEKGNSSRGVEQLTVGSDTFKELTTKRDEVHNIILSSIEESKKKDGSDPHHAHPVVSMMANYDWSGGIAKAGMSWGTVGHAVQHAAAGDGGKHHQRLKRSQTIDF
ncbi:hypothetical protein TrST_g3926 [Triparma strigata]|uniref:2',3'-cyclic-nucleotide 3'-phosphodiesterase n=1 Tax=Triparma strigata TaxID=1606541 RepID=A0A9W7BCG7_9STRA|nr:hypothetical protein TrST_g3926 [Triparma strigata]